MSSKAYTFKRFRRWLMHYGVSISRFGKGHAESLETLHALVEDGSVKPSLMPVLVCHKVKMDVYCEVDGEVFYLVEGGGVIPTNLLRPSNSHKRSMSVLVKKGETAINAARRGLQEHLGLNLFGAAEPEFYVYDRYYATPRLSNSFPGTAVSGPRAKVVTVLHPSAFRPEGYSDGKTHYHWEHARDLWGFSQKKLL